jgi:hypothetical protein
MKRLLILLMATFMVGVFVCSCGTTSSGSASPRNQIIGAEGIPRPAWVTSRPQGTQYADTADMIYFLGTGVAAMNTAMNLQTAFNTGMQALATWKESVTATIMKTYMDEYGELGNTQSLIGLETSIVTRAIANTSGLKEVDRWVDPNGVYIILYSYPKNDYRSDFMAATNAFVRNEAAAFAEFKADQAFRLLESQLDNAN